jgi:hypothetical protein
MILKARTNLYITLSVLVALVFLTPSVVNAEAGFISKTIYELVVAAFGSLMTLGGLLLNFGISHFVIGFGENFGSGEIGQTINRSWEIMRDVFNVTFIFGLIYLGFKMILNSEDANTRRWLIRLIMAAILINFSLLITKSIIDVSNLVASEIALNGLTNTENVVNVSDQFRRNMGINTVFSNDAVENLGEDVSPWPLIFMTMIVLIVAGFVFAAGGLLLMIRGAAMVLYMILSPVMFIGWVFPQLQKYTDQYWSGFLGRVFFAPIFLLLIYISSTILGGYNNITGSTDIANAMTASTVENPGASLMGSITPFILGAVFMVASLVVAAKMGANGGEAALGAGKKLTSKIRRGVGTSTAGLTAYTLRNSVGRKASNWANSDKGRARAANSYLGSLQMKAAKGIAGSSFDARRVGGVGKRLDIGEGQKGGYTQSLKDRKKKLDEELKNIETNIDLDDPQIQAEVAERAQEIKAEKQKQIADIDKDLEENKQEYEQTVRDIEAGISKLERSGGSEAEIKSQRDKLASIKNINQAKIIKKQQLTKERDSATEHAFAERQFANEIAYMKRKERKLGILGNNDNRFNTTAGAVAGGGLMASGVGAAGAGILASVAWDSEREGTAYELQELRKKFGSDGIKARKNQKRKKDLDMISEAIKENSNSDQEDSKESSEAKESDKE